MKRMKKKVVAMVTLAMFLMTLLPMAAFAATENSLTVTANKVDIKTAAVVTINTKDSTVTDAEMWVEKVSEPGKAVAKATITASDVDGQTMTTPVDGVYAKLTVQNGKKVDVKFPVAGDYVVKLGAWVATKEPGQAQGKKFVELATSDVITVTGCNVTKLGNDGELDTPATVKEVHKNGYQLIPVQVDATGAEEGAVVSIANAYESAGIKVVGADGKVTDKAAVDGSQKVTFYITVEKYTPGGEYRLDLACNDAKGVAVIKVAGAAVTPKVATTIEAPAVAGIIANDGKTAANFEAVKVVVKDQNGDVMTKDDLNGNEPIMGNVASDFTKVDYINVTKKPAKCTLEDADVALKQGKDALVLDAASKLDKYIPGDYAIEFVLKNGAKATATFTVGAFDANTAKDIVIESTNKNFEIPVTVNEQGEAQKVTGVNYTVYAVDANGIKSDITQNAEAAFAPAVNGVAVTFNAAAGTFDVEFNSKLKDVIGTKVTVTAFDKTSKKFATQDFTFVAADNSINGLADNKLTFEATDKVGKVLANNAVTAKLVGKDGQEITTAGDITVNYAVNETPVKVSDATAKVIVKQTKANKPGFTIYSDKPVTVDVQVVAWYKNTNAADKAEAVYGETFSYTIGGDAQKPAADKTVVMTIGSTNMVVNNVLMPVEEKDAQAPYVKNNRTYVPVNAVARAFGADVQWNADKQTVTVTLNNDVVVFTIGSKDYTVNGAKKTMDVAPEIAGGAKGRTMLPVRFVAEALNMDVTPLYAADGTTASVVFQAK